MKNTITILCLFCFTTSLFAQKIIKPAKKKKVKTEQSNVEIDPIIREAPTQSPAFAELEMVEVKGGTFNMGDISGKDTSLNAPIHTEIVEDFYIAKYEVSQWLWTAVMEVNLSKNFRYQCPVERVSYEDVQMFIKKLNGITGRKFRLPTEAEWEYAARGRGFRIRFGNGEQEAKQSEMNFKEFQTIKSSNQTTNSPGPNGTTTYIYDNNRDMNSNRGSDAYYQRANGVYYMSPTDSRPSAGFSSSKKADPTTLPIRSFFPNKLGLYNMSGNVAEWCSDTMRLTSNSYGFIVRGGSFYNEEVRCTTFNRDFRYPFARDFGVGFRLAED